MPKCFIIPLTALFLLVSCAPKELVEYYDFDGLRCSTTIEGELFIKERWPANGISFLEVRTMGRDTELMSGELIEINDSTLTFDQRRVSPTYDPKPTIIRLSKVEKLINGEGEMLIGKEKEPKLKTREFQFLLRNKETEETNFIKFRNDSKTSYCIEPGKYQIVDFTRLRTNRDSDYSSFFDNYEFMVLENKANYLGSFYMNIDSLTLFENHFKIPLKIKYRQNSSIFGAVGGIIYSLTTEKGVVDNIDLYIKNNADFESQNKNEIVFTSLILSEEEKEES